MLTFIIILYLFVACIGIYLLYKLISKTRPKMAIGVIHGILGLFGISLLIIYTSFLKGDTPYISILLFVLAFFFGGGMFAATLSGKKVPKVFPFIHIAIAILGIVFLISFWMAL